MSFLRIQYRSSCQLVPTRQHPTFVISNSQRAFLTTLQLHQFAIRDRTRNCRRHHTTPIPVAHISIRQSTARDNSPSESILRLSPYHATHNPPPQHDGRQRRQRVSQRRRSRPRRLQQLPRTRRRPWRQPGRRQGRAGREAQEGEHPGPGKVHGQADYRQVQRRP